MEQEWDTLVTAAKKEGVVAIQTLSGAGIRKTLDAFSEKYGITYEQRADASSSIWAPKIEKEQTAGIYTLDIAIVPANSAISKLRPTGAWEPIKPLMFRPNVVDEKAWRGGFSSRWADKDENLCFSWEFDVRHSVAINTSMVKEGEITAFPDLLKPQFKGKSVSDDPRSGGMWIPFARIRAEHGDEVVKRYFAEQELNYVRDPRQVAEAMVRGKYPVAFGLRPTAMQEFFAEGLGKDIKWLDIPVMGFVPGTGIFLASKAPHPNAAKLFTNWFLTKEGQDLHAMNVPTNSARLDAVVGSKYGIGTPGVSYFENSFEREYPALEATRPWLKEISGVG